MGFIALMLKSSENFDRATDDMFRVVIGSEYEDDIAPIITDATEKLLKLTRPFPCILE